MAEPYTTSTGTEVLWNLDAAESFRVVKASALLSGNMKLLWMEEHLLSRKFPSRGSFIIAEKMGQRLRIARSTIEQMRRAFLSFDLYLKKKGNGRGDSWMPCLPADCVPPRGEMTDEVFMEYGDRLDAHLRRRAALIPPSFFYVLDHLSLTHGIPRGRPTDTNGADPPDTTGETHGIPRARRAYRRSLASQEGGLGGVPSPETLKESSLLEGPEREGKSLTRLERREESEGRDGGAGEERGGVDPDVMAREMAALRKRLDEQPTGGVG